MFSLRYSYRVVWLIFVLSQYQCCSAQRFECYSLNNSTADTCWAMPYQDIPDHMWNCPKCTCAYNTYRNQNGECLACNFHGVDSANHIIMQLTEAKGELQTECEALRVCDKWYHFQNIHVNQDCVECNQPVFPCNEGQSVAWCTSYSDTQGCVDCTYPPIANTTSMKYGGAKQLPECGTDLRPPDCAYYLTPTWSLPTCHVICRPGFLDTNVVSNWLLPNCVQCATHCPVGFDLPACDTYSGPSSVQCHACLHTSKDPNAHWVEGAGCPWTCNLGYYRVNETCVPCHATTCGEYEIFLGCTGYQPGGCLDWTKTLGVCEISPEYLIQNSTTQRYLEYFIWSSQCTARDCSRAIAGQSYVSQTCGRLQGRFLDAQIKACDTSCPTGSFRVSACGAGGAIQNLQCQGCSPVPVLGMMLTRPCVDEYGGDAQYGPCDAGRGCDSRGKPFNCSYPRIGVRGICVCPPAMVDATDGVGCVVIPCADGTFPDPTTGNCSVCSVVDEYRVGEPAQLTVPGVLGPTACACSPGFFMNTSTNVCLLCGNLVCDGVASMQSDCPGGRTATVPECECQLPSGALAVVASDTLCKVACAPGFTFVAGAASRRMGSLVHRQSYTAAAADTSMDVTGHGGGAKRGLVVGDDIIVWVSGDGRGLWGAYRSNSDRSWVQAGRFNVTRMLINDVRVGEVTDLHVVSHDAWDLVATNGISQRGSYQGVWLLFSFLSDHCGETTTDVAMLCTSIERFVLLTRDEFPAVLVPTKLIGPFCANGNDVLCALYPINTFGGVSFVRGDARWSKICATASLTMGVIGHTTREFIFWSALTAVDERPVLVQYRCDIYVPQQAGNQSSLDDTPLQRSLRVGDGATLQLLSCEVSSLAFSNYALYGFASCAGILEWSVNIDTGLSAASDGTLHARVIPASALHVERGVLVGIFQMLPVVRSTLLSLASLGAIGSYNGKAYLLHVDLVNGRTWRCADGLQPPSVLSSEALARLLALDAYAVSPAVPVVHMTPGPGGLWAIWQQNTLQVLNGWDVCGVDRVSYDNRTCEIMPCVALMSGSKTRALESREFTCLPGFTSVNGICTLCEVGRYCIGGVSIACDAASQTTLGRGAFSASECICKPGFYMYASKLLTACLPCSTNAWCLGGSHYPVPCAYGGETLGFATSPLDCRCPSGTTYGLRCDACSSRSECYATKDVTHSLVALVVSGWGQNIKASVGLEHCLASMSASWIMYDMPHFAPLYDELVDTSSADSIVKTMSLNSLTVALSEGFFGFGWIVVVQDMNATVLADGTKDMRVGLRDCMERRGATMLTNVSLLQAPLYSVNFIADSKPCGQHITVDSNTRRCTLCEAGYEARYNQQYLTCVPCAPGTVRVLSSGSSDRCVPCADNNSYAPSMGMTACVCKPGFFLPALQNSSTLIGWYRSTLRDSNVYCLPNPRRASALEFLSVPMHALIVGGASSVLLVLSCYLLSMCLI